MAVFTPVTLSDARLFCQYYSDLPEITEIIPLQEGTDNSNFILKAGDQTRILTVFENRVDSRALPAMFDFAARLSEIVPTPRVYKNRHGDDLGILHGKPAALIEFLHGRSVDNPDARQCKLLGALLGRIHAHRASADLPVNPLSVAAWLDLFHQNMDVIKDYDADALIDGTFAKIKQQWPAPDDLPYGSVHADIFPDNVFFLDGQISGLIDFYFSCQDFYIYDLMLTLNAWGFDDHGQADLDKISAFLSGYQSARAIDPREAPYLSLMGQAAALRIALTRFRDLNKSGDFTPRDPKAYLEILKFHQNHSLPDILS